ncbi:uncharacterized protein [Solanum tuberosum]|uniref:uncharacterized protein isoform X2 n=1 Tax=Solanum tuberosum TaxID=4113 RepID=UPI00073A0C2C|nr:PREDICTED: uncharacterized protein LOC102583403 isoform X2 [Solanum tuberosum]
MLRLEAGVDGIIHLYTDELMHPAGSLELVSILYGDFWQIYLKMLTWSYFLTMSRCSRRIMTISQKKCTLETTRKQLVGNGGDQI